MVTPRKIAVKRNTVVQRDTTKPYDAEEHPEKQKRQKRYTASYKHDYQVMITRKMPSVKVQEIAAFAGKYITDFKGTAEDNPGVPHMLFERNSDAQAFADKLHAKLGIPKEHIAIKKHK